MPEYMAISYQPVHQDGVRLIGWVAQFAEVKDGTHKVVPRWGAYTDSDNRPDRLIAEADSFLSAAELVRQRWSERVQSN